MWCSRRFVLSCLAALSGTLTCAGQTAALAPTGTLRAAFLRDKKRPTEAEIKDALSGLKCRCGTHISILKAVKRAAEMMG